MRTERRNIGWFPAVCAAVLAAAAVLRVLAFSPGLEYDEIWTVRNYSARDVWTILNDLATPNNHPLNSLFVKWMLLFPASAWSIRFPSFIAGLASVALSGWLGFLLFRSRLAAFTGMVLTAVNPALILYSVTARGYSMQTALILLYAVLTVLAYRRKCRPAPLLIPVTGMLAELCLSTSVLWLFPISLVHFSAELLRAKRNWKPLLPLIAGYTVLAILLLGWIAFHYADFKAGQSFGFSVASINTFFRFLFSASGSVCGWGVTGTAALFALTALLLAVSGTRMRFRIGGVLLIFLFPFAAALLTLAGPARVYLTAVPFAALLTGLPLQRLFCFMRRRGLFPLFLLLPLLIGGFCYANSRAEWSRADWIERFELMKRIPADRFLCISATSSYPALWNNGDPIVHDYLSRFSALGEGTRFVQIDSPGVNGMNPHGSEDSIELAVPARQFELDGMKFNSYRVAPCRDGDVPDVVLVRVRNLPFPYYSELVRALANSGFAEKVLILNAFFVNAAQRMTVDSSVNAVAALKIRPDLPSHALFRRFYAANRGKFDFFVLRADSE